MKNLKLVVPALFLLVVLGVFGFKLLVKGKTETVKKEPTAPVVREVSLEERPFVSLTPNSGVKAVTLYLSNVSGVSVFDYTLIYDSNGVQRGANGTGLTLEAGRTDFDREILLGSCSKGVCTYDKNVSSGEFRLSLKKDEEVPLEFSANFHLQKVDLTSPLTSLDNKFRFEVADKGVVGQPYAITMMTIGLPAKVSGKKIVSKPYGVFASGNGVKKGKVVFAGMQNGTYFVGVYSNKSKDWVFLPGNFDASVNTVSAEASSSGTFLLVSE